LGRRLQDQLPSWFEGVVQETNWLHVEEERHWALEGLVMSL